MLGSCIPHLSTPFILSSRITANECLDGFDEKVKEQIQDEDMVDEFVFYRRPPLKPSSSDIEKCNLILQATTGTVIAFLGGNE